MAKTYKIILSRRAEKQLDKLSDKIAQPILDAIACLANNPRPHGCKKLRGRDGYRIRQGNYRVIYDIQDKALIVEVITVADRKEVYDL